MKGSNHTMPITSSPVGLALIDLRKFIPLILLVFFGACDGRQSDPPQEPSTQLVTLSQQTGISISVIKILESETGAKAKQLRRHESGLVDSNYPSQKAPAEKSVHLPGICVSVKSGTNQYALIKQINSKINKLGYRAFSCDGKDVNDEPWLAVLQCDDEFTPLVYMQTNGINYGLDNARLIARIKLLSAGLDLKLSGADFEWCEFKIEKDPQDWDKFAAQVYKLCPDIVEQGTKTVAELAKQMKASKMLYLWFD
eukprot:gene11669-13628_t